MFTINNIPYENDELNDIIESICAVNDIQCDSFTVDEDNERIILICVDPSNGVKYREILTAEELTAFVINMP